MIRKVRINGKVRYRVLAETGRHMGTYDTPEEAEKRLAQVEWFAGLKEGKLKAKSKRRGNTFTRLRKAKDTGPKSRA